MWKGAKGIYDDYYIILDTGTYISTDDVLQLKDDILVITGIDSEYNVYVFLKKQKRGAKYNAEEFIPTVIQSPYMAYIENQYMKQIQKNKEHMQKI
jgi:hypothetical protein